ncbi:DNA translocase FtsK [candidate division WWE3 bacterium]|uniref:DNA translocase FtsK n=1 Tax=candidate division WWE3 bacterium TaxID=2053526 RepID=A0A7X9DLB1_UNCKA|nr:DNA translocase FtsK [candidate division WWE3 bacterium]
MPRGRKKKLHILPKIKPDAYRSILAVFLLLFSLLSYVSFFFSDYALNSKIKDFWFGIFGYPSFIAPILVISIAFLLIPSIDIKLKEPRVILGQLLNLVFLSSMFHIFINADEALKTAQDGGGGGMLGYKVTSLLSSTISIYGAIIALMFLGGVSVILLFNISLDDIFSFIGEKLSIIKIPAGFSLPFKKAAAADDSDAQITTGGRMPEDNSSEFPTTHAPEAENHTPIVEIIPSFSEPTEITHTAKPSGSKDGKIVPMPSVLGPGRDRIWQYPPLDLLKDYSDISVDSGDVEGRKKKIKEVLKSFNIDVEIDDVQKGPSVTQYQLRTEFGTRVAQISGLQNDIAMALASPTGTVRIEAPIPGKSLIGIEVPNNSRGIVGFKTLITSDSMKAMKSKLGCVLGKDVGGKVLSYDIGKMPHMLVAGTTGSGKSIFIHNVLFSILYRATPHEVKFILIDPKRVELIHYQDIPHLITPVITDMDKAPGVFKWLVGEMERRYKLLEKARVPNIDAYNEQSGFQALHYIVMVVDELAEIMVIDSAGVEKSIIRLAQLARAVGIHLILAVQRPSTNIITGSIKANIPCRIAFNVASQVDSRVIIDQQGAEKLLGKGDMLFVPPDIAKPIRLQGGWVSPEEIKKLVVFLKDQGVPPMYDEGIAQMTEKSQNAISGATGDVDSLFNEAVEIVCLAKKASASLLQRKLAIGYARAARIMDELESKGIISPSDGTAKPRDVLINSPLPQISESSVYEEDELESLQKL